MKRTELIRATRPHQTVAQFDAQQILLRFFATVRTGYSSARSIRPMRASISASR